MTETILQIIPSWFNIGFTSSLRLIREASGSLCSSFPQVIYIYVHLTLFSVIHSTAPADPPIHTQAAVLGVNGDLSCVFAAEKQMIMSEEGRDAVGLSLMTG